MNNCSCGGAGCKMCAGQAPPKLFLPVEPMGAVRTTQKQKYKDPLYQKYAEYKTHIGLLAGSRLKRIETGKPIILTDVTFYMPIPASGTTTFMQDGKRKKVNVIEGMPHIKKPDIDNLIKGLFDSLNGIAWADDAQVYKITNAQKVYSEMPGIEFGIEFLN